MKNWRANEINGALHRTPRYRVHLSSWTCLPSCNRLQVCDNKAPSWKRERTTWYPSSGLERSIKWINWICPPLEGNCFRDVIKILVSALLMWQNIRVTEANRVSFWLYRLLMTAFWEIYLRLIISYPRNWSQTRSTSIAENRHNQIKKNFYTLIAVHKFPSQF